MERHESISEVIERAKQQRADYIGAAISKHPVAALVVVVIPFMLTQLQWNSSVPSVAEPAIQNEIVATSIAPTRRQPRSDRSLAFTSSAEANSRLAR